MKGNERNGRQRSGQQEEPLPTPPDHSGTEPPLPAVDQAVPRPARDSIGGFDLLLGIPVIWFGEFTIATFLVLYVGGGEALIENPQFLLASGVSSGLITILVTWSLVCRKYRKGILEGFKVFPIERDRLTLSVVIGIAGAIGGSLLMYGYSTGESFVARITSTPNGFMAFAALALLLPPVEEIYYRGFIFPALQEKLGGFGAVSLVTVWFGVAHAAQLAGDWAGVPVVTAMGALWTIQRYVSGSLTPSLVSHWIYNATLVLMGLAVL